MTYTRPIGYLGADIGETYRFDRYWELICFPGQPVKDLVRTMHAWNEASPSMGDADQSNDFKEDENPVRGLRLLWIRLGKVGKRWPGAQGEYNFGPTTYTDECPGGHRTYVGRKPANTIRVDREFWNDAQNRAAVVRRDTTPALPYPAALWQPHEDGYVRLRVDDPLLVAVWRNLVASGILTSTPQPNVSVKDDSAFVGALRTYYEDWAREIGQSEMRDPSGRSFWPEGMNFGPNTSGDELRVHPTLLFRVLNRADPRAVAARERAQTVLRGMRVKPPLLRGIAPVTPGARPLGAGAGRIIGGLQLRVQLGYLK